MAQSIFDKIYKLAKSKGFGVTYCGHNPKTWCVTESRDGKLLAKTDYLPPYELYNVLLTRL